MWDKLGWLNWIWQLPVRSYLPLIRKDSFTHMHALAVYVKEALPFARDSSLENSAYYFCFWLALLHSVPYQVIPFRDIDDQTILESEYSKRKPSHTQLRLVVLNVTFPSWLSPCKKVKISIGYFQFYCWSKNPSIGLDEDEHNT